VFMTSVIVHVGYGCFVSIGESAVPSGAADALACI